MRAVRSLLVIAACGSPQKPAAEKPDPMGLAAELDASMKQMLEIVHRRHGDCTHAAVELNALFKVMRRQIADVRKMQLDPQVAKQLKVAMDSYADGARGRDDAIVAELEPCRHDPDIMNVMRTMPDLGQ
jgi:hypothetical protein